MEAIAILGGINAATEVLWRFSRLVERYQGLPTRLVDVQHALRGCELSLDDFKHRWSIENRQPDFYYDGLWGSRGWREIRECLGAISVIVDDIKKKVNGILGSAVKRSARRSNYCDGHYDKELFKNAIKRIDGRAHRRIRFVWAVTLRADELDHDVERLEKYLITLERHAEKHIFASKPSLRGLDPREVQLKAQRLIQERGLEEARDAVNQAREDARSLHAAYTKNPLSCHLGIAQPEDKSKYDYRPNPDFSFLLSDGFETVEIKMHPARFRASPARLAQLSANMAEGFVALNQSLTQKTNSIELLPPGARGGNGFVMSLAQRPHLPHLNNQPALSALLQRSTNGTATLSQNRKAQVAASLVDGSHRLLGTPWLNTLDSSNVRGDKSSRNNDTWSAMLSNDPGNRHLNKALADLQMFVTYGTRDLTMQAQIYRLGVVLTEIATGARVTYAESNQDNRFPAIELTIPALGEDWKDTRLTTAELAREVEFRMGKDYADLVAFCLSVFEKKTKMTDLSLEKDFERSLLLPARQMREWALPDGPP